MSACPLPHIWTLTVMGGDLARFDRRQRVWGWYPTKQEAINAFLANPEWFLEMGYYHTVCIEGFGPGIACMELCEDEAWFSARYQGEPGTYDIQAIGRPEPLKGMCCHAMG